MLLYVYIAVSLILDGVLSGFCGLVNSWADIWIVLVLFIGLFLGILILHVIFAVVFSLFIDKGKRPDSLDTFVRRFALCTLDLYLRLIRVKVHASGMEKLPEGRFLLVSNHRTQIDPIIGLVLFRKQKVAFISKKENFKIPFWRQVYSSARLSGAGQGRPACGNKDDRRRCRHDKKRCRLNRDIS